MRQRVLVRVDDRLERRLGAVQDCAGRVEPRTELGAGTNELGIREHRFRVVRRIVRRRDAEGEVRDERPRGLRENAVVLAIHVGVGVDDARNDRLAAHLDPASPLPEPQPSLMVQSPSTRLPSTTIVPFSMTSARAALPAPAIVMIRAPTSASAPDGDVGSSSMNPIGTPFASGSAGLSAVGPGSARKANVLARSRVKYSGPSDQWTRRLSPDQWRYEPASREICVTGKVVPFGPRSIARPERGNDGDEGVPPLRERHVLAVGRRLDLRGVVRLEVNDLVAAVHLEARENELLAAALAEVDPLPGVIELRLSDPASRTSVGSPVPSAAAT